ncbi:beta strand repeat-containing protein [Celerinatantimonas yamalensis]|uniref:MBG domain-containing protein n=1 Tax=Celerinatantimonas yamalensis TaxID=559956 RepID=A0ABW9G6X7_9GAMM
MKAQKYKDVAASGFTRKCVVGVLIYTLTVQPVLAAATLPTAGSVAAGQVSIGTSGNTTTVTQRSDKAIVNWGSFSVGKGASVNFIQPGSTSAILNRVTGSTTSTIAGAIHANGQVFLINPNGIAITSTGSIKVGGGFVGSTLNISDKDFLNDHFVFKGDGASAGVSNAGIITVGRGGYAALIGGTVQNSGLIAVPLGKIGLGSGEQATLNLSGDGFLQVALPTKTGAEGNGALIGNQGTLSADGGTVLISVASARHAARHAINLSGVVEANSVSGRDGNIIIGGGQGGNVSVSGKVTATSASGKGGDITVTGKDIALNGATIDASGATGGGSIKIGGDYQGTGNTQRANTTNVDTTSVIRADATQGGNGGKVIVWSDDLTTFDGLITARGAGTGKGGNAEVSGKARLAYNGFTNLSGPGGFGTLLLDPYNVTISSDADNTSSGFTATGDDSVINVTTLQNALSAANVEVTTGNGGSQTGDIVVASTVTWSANTKLTLNAAGSIAVNAAMTASGESAGLVLNYGSDKDYYVNAPITLSGANATLNINGNDYTLIHSMTGFQASSGSASGTYFALAQDLDLSGNSFDTAPVTTFGGTLAGLGHTISNLTISASDLQYVGLIGKNSGAIRDLKLSGAKNTVLVSNQYSGNWGLLAGENIGTISNVDVVGTLKATININGYFVIGGLVGSNSSNGNISNSTSNVTLTANKTQSDSSSLIVGGLIGNNNGTITNSSSSGAVSAESNGGYVFVGGLIGVNSGKASTLSSSSVVKGVITGGDGYVSSGGLVGSNQNSIVNSYATGAVSAESTNSGSTAYAGGLVGSLQDATNNGFLVSDGLVDSSYAVGSTSAMGSSAYSGGLIGYLISGESKLSFFDEGTTNQANGVGNDSAANGVNGLTTEQARNSSNYTGWDFTNTWYQSGDMRPILRSEAATAVGGVISVSNLHQLALIGANFSGTYHLTRNIDASATNSTADSSGIWGSGGFVPLGDNTNGFTGTFDGQSHVISNLTINRPLTGYVGLFGYVGSGGIIRNVGIEGGSVTGGSSDGDYQVDTGSLAGQNFGTISNAYATGAVMGNASFNNIGGLVGSNNGTISNAYATGAVKFTEHANIGGLVGSNNGTISNAYATGAVTEGDFVGGLVGQSNGTITSSFWDTETTGQASSAGGGTGLTTTGMKTLSNFSDWNIDNKGGTGTVWRIYDGYTMPLLRSFMTKLTISGGSVSKTYDGSATSTSVGTLTYSDANYDSSLVNGTAQYTASSANAGSYSGSNLTISGLYSSQQGYDISTKSGSLMINKAALTVTADKASKTYGDTAALTYKITGLVTGDSLSGALASDGAGSGANVGSYDITQGTLANSNYTITYKGANLTVTARPITVTASAGQTMVYGNSTPTLNYGVSANGLVNGDKLTGALATTADSSSDVGSYSITQGSLGNSNYTITYRGNKLAVTPATLTVTATGSQTYGSTTPTYQFTASGWKNGQSDSNLTGLSYSTTATSTSNAGGSYTTTASDGSLSGAAKGNYTLSYAAGTFTVNKAALTVTATGSQTYGSTTPTYQFTASGWKNGQSDTNLTGLSYTTTATSTSNAGGSYTATASGGTLGDKASGNYTLSYAAGTFTVNKAALTVTATGSQTYGSTTPTYQFTASGWKNGQSDSNLTGLSYSTTATSTSNAGGSYTATASGGTLGDKASGNYTLSYAAGTFTVNKAALTVTANDASKTYDGKAYTGGNGVTYSGLVNNETSSVLGGTLAYGGTAQNATNAGSYGITASGLTSGNYDITYNAGQLTVNKAALTVTANDAAKTYDGQAYTGGNGVTYSGLVNNETSSVLGGTLAYSGTAQNATNAGSYDITASGLTSGNYTIAYKPGQLTVNKAALTVTANDASKTYDGQAYTGGNGVTYSGLVNNETSSVLGGTLAYGGTSQNATNAGSYGITASGLSANNYAITYKAGQLTVNKAVLMVTANDGAKTYDGQAYTGGNGVTYSGLVNNETSSVLGGTLAYGGTSQGATNAGSYGITASGLSANNYAITYKAGQLTVNKAVLTVTANDGAKTYDGQAYTGGNGVTYSGLVNNETSSVLGGTLAYGGTSQGATNAGSYGITASGLSANNYAITYKAGQLTVNKAALTVTANDASKTYDGQAYTGGNGVTYSGLVNNETSSVLGGTLAYGGTSQNATNAGSYGITASGLSANNYAITYKAGQLTVNKAVLMVTANDGAKTYDGQAYTGGNGVTYSGLVNNETSSVLGGTLAYGGTSQGATNAGSYGITASGLSANNYAITYKAGQLTVNKAVLTVTANDASKTYDGQAYTGGNGVTYSGLVNNETSSVLGGTLAYGGTSQGAINVGNYTITASGLTSGNYDITYVPGQLGVTAAPNVQPDASQIVNMPTFTPVHLVPRVGQQLVSYETANTDTSRTGQGDIMTTQDIRLTGAVCFAGSDFATTCSATN